MIAAHTNALRRVLITIFACVTPLSACASADRTGDIVSLMRRADEGNQAFIRGEMHRWYATVGPIADDFTLMAPFGGVASHGFDGSPERLDAMARRFRNGEATLEIEQTYITPDMAVLVMIERQRGEVGDLPAQNWSLRVTQVYRRDGGVWALVHRHADPLTRERDLQSTAALARD